MADLKKLKPAVPPRALLLFAGLMWIGVGVMLVSLAAGWLHEAKVSLVPLLIGIGVFAALIIHHFGFLRVVDRNLGRILAMQGKRCAFSFISWKSYLLIGVMMGMGLLLRHSPIPKPCLAALYIAIGLALILSSVRYLRYLLWPPKRAGAPASGDRRDEER